MYGRMKCLVGGAVDQGSPRGAARRVSPASGRVHKAAPSAAASADPREKGAVICFRPPDIMEMVHDVAVYIHRFHNLDLFQQGYGRGCHLRLMTTIDIVHCHRLLHRDHVNDDLSACLLPFLNSNNGSGSTVYCKICVGYYSNSSYSDSAGSLVRGDDLFGFTHGDLFLP